VKSQARSTRCTANHAKIASLKNVASREEIHRRGPWKGLEDVEFATLEWVAWYNHRRLLEPLGYLPPAEFSRHTMTARPPEMRSRFSRNEVSGKPGAVHGHPPWAGLVDLDERLAPPERPVLRALAAPWYDPGGRCPNGLFLARGST